MDKLKKQVIFGYIDKIELLTTIKERHYNKIELLAETNKKDYNKLLNDLKYFDTATTEINEISYYLNNTNRYDKLKGILDDEINLIFQKIHTHYIKQIDKTLNGGLI